jgi:hypothetical protein
MILTEYISDDTSRLAMLPGSSYSSVVHRVEDASVYWLHTISYIREGSLDDHRHRVVEVARLHLIDDITVLISDVRHTEHEWISCWGKW